MTAPTHLRAEHRADALGIGVRRPRLSWRLPEGTARQLAYELRVDDETSLVDGAEQTLVPWPARSLGSGERRLVRVRVTTDLGVSDWSEPLAVEAGLLDAEDWVSVWVSPTEPAPPAGRRPAYRLRGDLTVGSPVTRARLHVGGLGLVEPWLDGKRVGRDELLPGYTEYGRRRQVATYDVTDRLTPGAHTLGALLADGWFRGQVGAPRGVDQWGETTALLAQLVLDHADGSRTVRGTDETWTWQRSHITSADLIDGQREDLRLLDPAWCTPGGDAVDWAPVATTALDPGLLVVSPAPPVRPVAELRPVAVTRLRPGVHVVDLGQNINGRVRLDDLGPAGTTLTLTHGEALDADGDVTTDHLVPNLPIIDEPLTAGQVDQVVAAGRDGETFDPRFTTHGFRYVRVEGHPGPLTEDDVTGVVVHTDLEPRGAFSCSDDRLNRLHDAAVWSLRGNACDIPTDCPTRERAGWTGDWQLFIPTATYLYDVAGFSLKWLRDLVATQWDNGILGNMAPMPPLETTGIFEKTNGSAGWGDAIVLVPWELHGEYGDTAVLAEMWPAMERWIGRAVEMARTARHPDRAARRPEPAPHEEVLWDSGFHWGEWLEPGGEPTDFLSFIKADKSDVATAFLAWSSRHAAAIADVLGRAEEAAEYADLSRRVTEAWQAEFLDADGRVTPHSQANLVRSLRFGLLPEHLRAQAADDLARLVAAGDFHVGTGFLATPDLLPVLADHGHLDAAYAVLLQDSPPSWLAMVGRGATTVWERWDGIDDDGRPHESLNHYSKGAVVSFLHRYVAGLQRVEPRWRRFRVEPRPGGGITHADAEHWSPYGRHAVSWRWDGTTFHVTVTTPPGTTGEVVLPDGESHALVPGTTHVATTLRMPSGS